VTRPPPAPRAPAEQLGRNRCGQVTGVADISTLTGWFDQLVWRLGGAGWHGAGWVRRLAVPSLDSSLFSEGATLEDWYDSNSQVAGPRQQDQMFDF
jgi:hypothetical protein